MKRHNSILMCHKNNSTTILFPGTNRQFPTEFYRSTDTVISWKLNAICEPSKRSLAGPMNVHGYKKKCASKTTQIVQAKQSDAKKVCRCNSASKNRITVWKEKQKWIKLNKTRRGNRNGAEKIRKENREVEDRTFIENHYVSSPESTHPSSIWPDGFKAIHLGLL